MSRNEAAHGGYHELLEIVVNRSVQLFGDDRKNALYIFPNSSVFRAHEALIIKNQHLTILNYFVFI